MTSFSDLKDGQVTQFKRILDEGDVSAEDVRDFLRHRGRVGSVRSAIRGDNTDSGVKPRNDVINGLLTPPRRQVELVGQTLDLLGEKVVDNQDARLQELERDIPDYPKGDGLPGLVLRVRFPSKDKISGVERTWRIHRRIIAMRHDNCHQWGEIDRGKVSLLAGGDTQKPCIEWCTVEFNPEGVGAPKDVRDPQKSPADELLAAAWQHRTLVESMDGETIRYWWVNGYLFQASGSCSPGLVPNISFYQHYHKVNVDASSGNDGSQRWASPVLRRE